jgi:hypothetical protein
MTDRSRFAAGLVPLVGFAISLAAPAAHAQSKSLAGAWTLVSNVSTDASGKKEATYGEKPMGQIVFSADGRYTLLITKPDIPKVAANNRTKGTTEENKAVVGGSLAHYGTYKVDDKAKAIVFNIESSTFPNWNGTTQQRPYTMSGNQLKWNTPASSGGGTSDLVWKRVK